MIDGKFEGVKYKFQGTSITPLIKNKNIFSGVLKKLNIGTDSNFDMRHMSINIKHKKKSKNLKNIRRYNLKSSMNDQDITVIAMNSIAKNIGLLAPESEYKIVRINGLDIGLFIFTEDFKKEWFEREHNIQIFNYKIY